MFTPIPLRAAAGAEEEVILEQVRVVRPRGPFLRRGGLPLGPLVDGVSLLVIAEEPAEDLHVAERPT